MQLYRNPLKRKILGGFILDKNDLGKSKKRENVLALLKVWEEEMKIKNEINKHKVKLKEKNNSPEIV